jgi:hypothetical protein
MRTLPSDTLRLLVATATLLVAGCGSRVVDLPPFDFIEPPVNSRIDAVIFLVGDAGDAVAGHSPLIQRLTEHVEEWSRGLARDSAVSVVYLGDIVYPSGLHEPGHPDRPADSLRLWTQIDVVGGEAAREFNSFAWFLPGNHDWGQAAGDAGIARILSLDSALVGAKAQELNVALVPPAASPGPVVRDMRRNVRLVAFDTHWFLQERAPRAKDAFFERVTEALTGAGNREVIFMAHHPYRSAGPHGALVSTTRALGILYLFKKSGTLIQDLNSPIYRDFLVRLDRAVAQAGRPPLVFAAGHDHSLQVLVGEGPTEPRFSLVSGAASKVSEINQVPQLAYAASRPGYMLLVFRNDDAVELYVHAGDPAYLSCDQVDEAERALCMTQGVEAFEVVYSATLLDGVPLPIPDAIPETEAQSGDAPTDSLGLQP